MFRYHPEIMRELGQTRRARDLDAAKRERQLASAAATHRALSVRGLGVALIAAAPIVLVMVWVLVTR